MHAEHGKEENTHWAWKAPMGRDARGAQENTCGVWKRRKYVWSIEKWADHDAPEA